MLGQAAPPAPAAAPAAPAPPPTPLVVPAEVSGELVAAGAAGEGSRPREYLLSLEEGQRVSVRLNSSQFDPVLSVIGPGGADDVVAQDDDSGGELNAALTFTAPRRGNYIIQARSFLDMGVGTFQLRAAIASTLAPLRQIPTSRVAAEWGSVGGALAALGPAGERSFHDYRLTLPRCGEAVIRLDSTEFDPTLAIYPADRRDGEPLAQNDDGGGIGLNSLLVFRSDTGGSYVIRVAALGGLRGGNYNLQVSQLNRGCGTSR